MTITGRDLFNLKNCRKYRALAQIKNYGESMVPAVGKNYGNGLMPKLVYCGAATRERDFNPEESAEEAYENAVIDCQHGFEGVPTSKNHNF